MLACYTCVSLSYGIEGNSITLALINKSLTYFFEYESLGHLAQLRANILWLPNQVVDTSWCRCFMLIRFLFRTDSLKEKSDLNGIATF